MVSRRFTETDAQLAQESLIPSADGVFQYVSVRHIFATGQVPSTVVDSDNTLIKNHYIEWPTSAEAGDLYVLALGGVVESVSKRIDDDEVMQRLLDPKNTHWDMSERVLWEAKLADITSYELANFEFDGHKPFQNYRVFPGDREDGADVGGHETAQARAVKLNDLAIDVLTGQDALEFDCEAMTLSELFVMRLVEAKHLPQDISPDNLKGNALYYYAAGFALFPENSGGHAYGISSVTGNIIEGTASPLHKTGMPYKITNAEGFSDHVLGKRIVARDIDIDGYVVRDLKTGVSIYGPLPSTQPDQEQEMIQIREGIIADGDFDDLAQAHYDDLVRTVPDRAVIFQQDMSAALSHEVTSVSYVSQRMAISGRAGVFPYDPQVEKMQDLFKKLGYELDVDGMEGDQTRAVIFEFGKSRGLDPDHMRTITLQGLTQVLEERVLENGWTSSAKAAARIEPGATSGRFQQAGQEEGENISPDLRKAWPESDVREEPVVPLPDPGLRS